MTLTGEQLSLLTGLSGHATLVFIALIAALGVKKPISTWRFVAALFCVLGQTCASVLFWLGLYHTGKLLFSGGIL